MIENVYWPSCAVLLYRYSCQVLMIPEFSRQVLKKSSNVKFHGNLSSVSRAVPCGKPDRQT